VYLPNTLALTPFPFWIGSTYGIGLFLKQGDEDLSDYSPQHPPSGHGCGGPYHSGQHAEIRGLMCPRSKSNSACELFVLFDFEDNI